MPDFYVILDGTNPRRSSASLDLSIDTNATGGNPLNLNYKVYGSTGDPIAEFVVPTNALGFASSASAAAPNNNLVTVANGEVALVRGQLPAGAPTSTAVLRQKFQNSWNIIGVPAARKSDQSPYAMGPRISVAMGSVVDGAALLIANVSDFVMNVDIFLGQSGPQGTGKYNNGALGANCVWKQPLQANDANSHLIIKAQGNIIALLTVKDNGLLNSDTEETMIFPAEG